MVSSWVYALLQERLTSAGIIFESKAVRHARGNCIYIFECSGEFQADRIIAGITTRASVQCAEHERSLGRRTNGTRVGEITVTPSRRALLTARQQRQMSAVS